MLSTFQQNEASEIITTRILVALRLTMHAYSGDGSWESTEHRHGGYGTAANRAAIRSFAALGDSVNCLALLNDCWPPPGETVTTQRSERQSSQRLPSSFNRWTLSYIAFVCVDCVLSQ